MNHHRHTHLGIFFVAVLLLLAARPARGQQQFTVIVDTVYLTAGEDMPIDYNDYSLRYKQTFPFYEDDRYTVFYERHWHLEGGGYVIFEEKETSWYPVTKNGWLQYEPVHRRYLCDGVPGRIIRTDSAYYLVYPDRVCRFDIGDDPGQIGYLNELPKDDFFELPWWNEKWYYPNNVGNTLNKREFKGNTFVVHGCNIGRKHRFQKPDTCIEQAFCVDNRIYCIMTTLETTSIEWIDNGCFKRVADLGRRFDFINGFYPLWRLDDHLMDLNRNNDGCWLVFEEDAVHNGTVTVKDSTVHIQYVRSRVLP